MKKLTIAILLFIGFFLINNFVFSQEKKFVDGKDYYNIEGTWHSITTGNYFNVKYLWEDGNMIGFVYQNLKNPDISMYALRMPHPENKDVLSTTFFLADYGDGKFYIYQVLNCFNIATIDNDKNKTFWEKE